MKNIHFIPDDLQYSDKVSSQEDIKEVLLSYNSHNAIDKFDQVQYFQASFIAFHWLHIKCAQMTSLTFTKINTNLFTTQLLILTQPQIRKSGQNQMSFISDHFDMAWTVNTQENAAIKLHYYLSSSVPPSTSQTPGLSSWQRNARARARSESAGDRIPARGALKHFNDSLSSP